MQALEGLEGSRLARQATEAGLTGQFGGAATVAEQNRLDALKTQDLQRRLATAGATGELDLGGSQQPVTTLQAQALEQEMQGQALNRALQRAGATGEFREEGDTGPAVDTLESRLRTAQLTGRLGDEGGGKATIAGRQADMDMIGAILASQDDALTGMTPNQKAEFGGALAASMDSMDPYQVSALRRSLGVENVQSESEQEQFAADQRAAQEPILQSLGFTPEEMAMFFDRGMDVTTIMDLRNNE
jgi:hypothetical protein